MKIDPNAPAFPWEDTQETTGLPRPHPGLTVRAHFALETAKGILSNPNIHPGEIGDKYLADLAMFFTNALIADLNK